MPKSTRRELLLAIFLAVALGTNSARAECLSAAAGPSDKLGREYKTTGIPELDAAFNTEANHLHRLFGVTPNLMIIDDWRTGANAFASPEITLAGYPDGTVRYGVKMLRDRLWSERYGPIAVAGILAHEFAHVLQFSRNGRLLQAPSKYAELQADYLAGYYVGKRGVANKETLDKFFNSFYDIGSDRIWSPDHHGTKQERKAASIAGYLNAGLTPSQAWVASEEWAAEQ